MENIPNDYQPDGFEVVVSINSPQQKSQFSGKYYIYPIKGQDKHGSIDIHRRYSDFDHLRNALVARWPGCFITSLPEKKYIGNNQQQFIQVRRKGLEQFLRIISKISHLWYCQEMQLFLKQNSGDVQKQISALVTRTSPIQLTQRYQNNFKKFEGVQLTHQMNNKILQFSLYLKQVLPMLDNLILVSEAMAQARKTQKQNYIRVLQFMLPQYEKNSIKEYLPEVHNTEQCLVFWNSNSQKGIQQAQKQLKDSFNSLQSGLIMQGMKQQKRQILSFLDTIRVRDEFEAAKQRAIGKVKDFQIQKQKISAGKTSVLAKIRSLSTQQQLQMNQKELDDALLQQKQYTYIINMINILLTHIEIQKFKKLRERTYYSLLRHSLQVEKENQKKLYNFWRAVGSHDLVGANVFLEKHKKKSQFKNSEQKMIQEETKFIEQKLQQKQALIKKEQISSNEIRKQQQNQNIHDQNDEQKNQRKYSDQNQPKQTKIEQAQYQQQPHQQQSTNQLVQNHQNNQNL